jgi:hypothetical protein
MSIYFNVLSWNNSKKIAKMWPLSSQEKHIMTILWWLYLHFFFLQNDEYKWLSRLIYETSTPFLTISVDVELLWSTLISCVFSHTTHFLCPSSIFHYDGTSQNWVCDQCFLPRKIRKYWIFFCFSSGNSVKFAIFLETFAKYLLSQNWKKEFHDLFSPNNTFLFSLFTFD